MKCTQRLVNWTNYTVAAMSWWKNPSMIATWSKTTPTYRGTRYFVERGWSPILPIRLFFFSSVNMHTRSPITNSPARGLCPWEPWFELSVSSVTIVGSGCEPSSWKINQHVCYFRDTRVQSTVRVYVCVRVNAKSLRSRVTSRKPDHLESSNL